MLEMRRQRAICNFEFPSMFLHAVGTDVYHGFDGQGHPRINAGSTAGFAGIGYLGFFMKLFPAVLGDNGPEFSEPKMIEFYRVDPKHNPTKLARRTWMFFCDPYCSSQKPHVENNHLLVRRVLTKGASFNCLKQEQR